MINGRDYDIAANGDVTIYGEGDIDDTQTVIPAADFAVIAEESKTAAWGHSDLPVIRGMI